MKIILCIGNLLYYIHDPLSKWKKCKKIFFWFLKNLILIFWIFVTIYDKCSDIIDYKYSLLENKQLFQSMYRAKIKRLQNMRPLLGSWCTIATAKLLIFSLDMLWESCSKWYFEHFLHSMYCINVYSLATT